MRVASIFIDHFCGLEELEFEPGAALTEIRGTNGVGKSSVIRALQALVGERLDVQVPLGKLTYKGAAEAQVGIVLSNGQRFARKWQDGATTLEGFDAAGKALKSPKAALREVLDTLCNPVDFLLAEGSKRTSWLIEAAPITLTSEELAAAVGNPDRAAYRHLQSVHALVAIERLHDSTYKARHETNVAADQRLKTIEQLRGSLPPETAEGRDWDSVCQEQEGRLARAEMLLIEADRTAAKLLSDLERETEAGYRTEEAELKADAERRIAAIREQLAGDLREARSRADETIRAAREAKDRVLAEQKPALQAERDDAQAALSEARARRDEVKRAAGTRTLVADMEKEAAGLQAKSAGLTRGLENLKALKLKLLDRMPVPGLEIGADGQLYREGVPFDLLNEAQQVRVAIEIAEARAGKCGLICVDGLEKLAPSVYAEFKRQALESGLQYIITRNSDDAELVIKTDAEAAA